MAATCRRPRTRGALECYGAVKLRTPNMLPCVCQWSTQVCYEHLQVDTTLTRYRQVLTFFPRVSKSLSFLWPPLPPSSPHRRPVAMPH
jgi:hypothetical protein